LKEIVTALYTNRCLAFSKMNGKDDQVLEDANYVLYHLDTKNVKALFWRAVVHKNKKEYSKAIKDLNDLLEHDKNNKAAKEEV